MRYQDGLELAHAGLDPLAALRAPVDILLGITDAARDTLRALGVATVYDLATSPLCTLAHEIAEAARGQGGGAVARLGMVPGAAIHDDAPDRPDDLAGASLASLRSLDAAQIDAIERDLHVAMVGDLGRWLPFRSARAVLAAATNGAESTDDAGELVPLDREGIRLP